jgi:hypothetical protein
LTGRYRFISEHHATYGVARLCRVLAVERRQGYYEWLAARPARQEREQAEEQLVAEIRAIHGQHRGGYGSPRVHDELRRRGRAVNRKRVERLMRERRIVGITRRRRRSLTKPDAKAAPAPDLIGRDFTAAAPGQRLVGDNTYLPTAEGWLYLATVIDLSRWSADDLEAVALALNNRPRKILGWRTPAEVFEEQLRSTQQAGVATTG